jgi:cytochrome P450
MLNISQHTSPLASLAVRKIQKHKEQKEVNNDVTSRYLAASEKDPEIVDATAVVGLAVSTLHAGPDTTAAASGIAMAHLLHHPPLLSKLLSELTNANLSSPPKFSELNKLHYLDACLCESMRFEPIVG